MKGARRRPPCGHRFVRECPLTARDWETIYFAWLGFLQVCRAVSEAAHERAKT